jgi:hypothetical protein
MQRLPHKILFLRNLEGRIWDRECFSITTKNMTDKNQFFKIQATLAQLVEQLICNQ